MTVFSHCCKVPDRPADRLIPLRDGSPTHSKWPLLQTRLLGLQAERPRHDYEIEKTLEERGMREWTDLAFSSIYYLVKKLERAGRVSTVDDISWAGDQRRRRTYALTAEGLAVARTGTPAPHWRR